MFNAEDPEDGGEGKRENVGHAGRESPESDFKYLYTILEDGQAANPHQTPSVDAIRRD